MDCWQKISVSLRHHQKVYFLIRVLNCFISKTNNRALINCFLDECFSCASSQRDSRLLKFPEIDCRHITWTLIRQKSDDAYLQRRHRNGPGPNPTTKRHQNYNKIQSKFHLRPQNYLQHKKIITNNLLIYNMLYIKHCDFTYPTVEILPT